MADARAIASSTPALAEISPPKISLIVIQASPFCNIDCRYCYLPNRASRQIIDERTLELIFQRASSTAYLQDEVSLLWHVGDALALPISLYAKAYALLARLNSRGVRIEQLMQTNATLITQEWCDFFRSHQVHVSVSIDGPEQLHDANRVSRSGR